MTDKEIKEKITDVRKRIKEENLRHEIEIEQLRHEIDMIRLHCTHSQRSSRWVMGREEVSECDICDKEI